MEETKIKEAAMSIKEKIQFCGTTNIPQGSRVEITSGYIIISPINSL